MVRRGCATGSSAAPNGLNTKMARLRGRALRGERLRAGVPHGHWRTTALVAGLRVSGMDAPMVIDGPINGESFLACVRQVLVPTLRAGRLDGLACPLNLLD